MKTNNEKAKPNSDKNLTRDIAIVYVALLAILMFFPVQLVRADINPSNIENSNHELFPALTAVGQGELTWFGISIYEASLWSTNGKFLNLEETLPIAFTITYERNITSTALSKRTIKEWQHLGIFSEQTRNYWGEQLVRIWPDVKPGDSITTLVSADRKTHFYHNQSLLSVIEDPTFGTALLAIWLDANTSEPKLREKLIGHRGGNND